MPRTSKTTRRSRSKSSNRRYRGSPKKIRSKKCSRSNSRNYRGSKETSDDPETTYEGLWRRKNLKNFIDDVLYNVSRHNPRKKEYKKALEEMYQEKSAHDFDRMAHVFETSIIKNATETAANWHVHTLSDDILDFFRPYMQQVYFDDDGFFYDEKGAHFQKMRRMMDDVHQSRWSYALPKASSIDTVAVHKDNNKFKKFFRRIAKLKRKESSKGTPHRR